MSREAFFINHVLPLTLGALCMLPEIVNGATLWRIPLGAGLGWLVWWVGQARVDNGIDGGIAG